MTLRCLPAAPATTVLLCSVTPGRHRSGRRISQWNWTDARRLQTEALLVHPASVDTLQHTTALAPGLPIEWSKTVLYLGVTIDNRLSWRPAVDDLRKGTARYSSQLVVSLRAAAAAPRLLPYVVYNAVASARVLYRAPVASLSACQLAALDTDHRKRRTGRTTHSPQNSKWALPSLRQGKRPSLCGSPKQLSTTCGA
ncbi:hypothetical protein HPB52_024714 [Rhipicephalus sanguineus]|uniref:Uncharacterized protein n=1 Tax=Rhipicephalus sanguineus TaxID=34632 RepID=A0A9D4TDX7_RHISA|nr:hypothetical protein HPB52_024714 [Rhipicephalus sanguineus]